MHFKVKHHIEYKYSKPVFLEPQVIKLYPKSNNNQLLKHFNILVSPEPFCTSKHTDAEGNAVFQYWFQDLTEQLSVEIDLEAQTLRSNPFDYLTDPFAETLPVNYGQLKEYKLLKPYIEKPSEKSEDDYKILKAYSDSIASETDFDTGQFLISLTKNLFTEIEYQEREEGNPYPATYTLKEKRGSCRDLSVLFNALCRIQGLACRFVSGYHLLKDNNRKQVNNNNLHAWSEVYIPGGGWRGYDPTQGYATDDRYLIVASSLKAELATPILGTFRGTDATTNFSYFVNVSEAT